MQEQDQEDILREIAEQESRLSHLEKESRTIQSRLATLKKELHELGIKNGEQQKFASRLEELRQRHWRKPSLLERLDRARLGSLSADGFSGTV